MISGTPVNYMSAARFFLRGIVVQDFASERSFLLFSLPDRKKQKPAKYESEEQPFVVRKKKPK